MRRDTDAETVVRRFFRAVEAADAAGALRLLDEDFVFRDAEGRYRARREQMSDVIAWDAAADARIELLSLDPDDEDDEVVRVGLRERSRFTDVLGLEPFRGSAVFTVRDGRIREEVVTETPGEGDGSFTERFHRALEPVVRWAAEARPSLAEEVFVDGRVARYDGATARRLLRLLEEWKERA